MYIYIYTYIIKKLLKYRILLIFRKINLKIQFLLDYKNMKL